MHLVLSSSSSSIADLGPFAIKRSMQISFDTVAPGEVPPILSGCSSKTVSKIVTPRLYTSALFPMGSDWLVTSGEE